MANRKEFLDRSNCAGTGRGISLLIDGPLARSGHPEIKDPFDERNAAILSAGMTCRRGILMCCGAQGRRSHNALPT